MYTTTFLSHCRRWTLTATASYPWTSSSSPARATRPSARACSRSQGSRSSKRPRTYPLGRGSRERRGERYIRQTKEIKTIVCQEEKKATTSKKTIPRKDPRPRVCNAYTVYLVNVPPPGGGGPQQQRQPSIEQSAIKRRERERSHPLHSLAADAAR